MHHVVKWPNVLQKSCGVHTARFLKYVSPFYKIMHERVNNLDRMFIRRGYYEYMNNPSMKWDEILKQLVQAKLKNRFMVHHQT